MPSSKFLNHKNINLKIAAIAIAVLNAATSFANTSAQMPFHLDLDAPVEVMQKMLEAREMEPAFLREPSGSRTRISNQALKPIVEVGKRGLDWLKAVNAVRNPEQRISFSSKETQLGYPISTPKESNVKIIQTRYADWKIEAPEAIRVVLLSGQSSYPSDLSAAGVTDEEFLKWGLELNRIYQNATRWLLQLPHLKQYAMLRKSDVRGFYFLQMEQNLEAKLKGWKQVADPERARLRPLLVGLCFNDSMSWSLSLCDQQMDQAQSKNRMFEFYEKYLPAGKKKWASFYTLENARGDVEWTSANSSVMTFPFIRPESDVIRAFMQDNVEDEWRLPGWNLKLDFLTNGNPSETAHVVFQPGVTPHVNGLGGNTITMDANEPLSEYNVQWTIRHEFGHVLGFPDCYQEFYDELRGVMVSYQLDITNLMCSRRGELKQTHYDELKKNYYR